MDFSRRQFLAGSLLTFGAIGVSSHPLSAVAGTPVSGAEDRYRGALPILQTLTNENSAQFTVMAEKKKKYGYQVVDSDGKTLSVSVLRREVRKFSNWAIDKLMVSGLNLGRPYLLKVIDPISGKVIDERYFSAVELSANKGSFVIASCMKDTHTQSREIMWDAVGDSKPDYVFLIGDTCYADQGLSSQSESGYWERYAETRALLSHFRQKKLIPTLACWDDHDYGGNGYDGSFKLKDVVKELFHIFWGAEDMTQCLQCGPGVSKVFTAFGQRFFLMDSRYHRNTRSASGQSLHWGRLQEEFLFSQLSVGNAPALLLNGSQFFGSYLKKDAFEYDFEQNLKDVCREISKYEAPVAFASGDIHYSEVMALEPEILGYQSFEFTSSSIHSTTFPALHHVYKNPRRMAAVSNHNFLHFTSENMGASGWSVKVTSFSDNLRKNFEKKVLIKRS